MNTLRICGLAAALACAPLALGEGFVVGAAYGTDTLDQYSDYVTQLDDGSFTSESVDDSAKAMRFYLGYDFTENFGMRLGYTDLGEWRTDAVSNGCCLFSAGPVAHSISADGVEISFIGKAQVGESGGVFVRFGSLSWDAAETISDSSFTFSVPVSGKDTFFAIGASYSLNDRWALAGEYTQYALDSFDVTALLVSLEYCFGN